MRRFPLIRIDPVILHNRHVVYMRACFAPFCLIYKRPFTWVWYVHRTRRWNQARLRKEFNRTIALFAEVKS